jgi:Anti-sigma-K factor rskA, C-terminal
VSASDNERIAYLSGEPVDSLTPQERAELDELRALLDAPAAWEEPDPALEDRVVAAIAQESARARATETAPATAAASPKPVRLRWRLRTPALAFGGLAAAAAAIAVALVIALGGSSTKPLQFAMVVTGTPLAPGAHGSATLTKTASGWRIELSAAGLPHLANGRYYQAWLKNSAGILVPIGTFNDGRKVTLWSGAPVTQFRTLTVTRQTANGNPASSGQRVLVGIAHPVR